MIIRYINLLIRKGDYKWRLQDYKKLDTKID